MGTPPLPWASVPGLENSFHEKFSLIPNLNLFHDEEGRRWGRSRPKGAGGQPSPSASLSHARCCKQQTPRQQHLHHRQEERGGPGHALPVPEAHQRHLGAGRAPDPAQQSQLHACSLWGGTSCVTLTPLSVSPSPPPALAGLPALAGFGVIPEMPSTRGVPVHLPSLRDHPEELRCCCSPSSSSSSLPFPPEEAGLDPCACPLSFLPRKQPLGFSLSRGLGAAEGAGGCPQSLHPCSIPCVSDAVSPQLPPDVFHPPAVGGCSSTSQKPQLLVLALREWCLVVGSAFQTLGIAAGGPRVPSD